MLVSAGTNDFYAADFETEVAGVLDLLGPKRCVVWADIARPEIVNGTSVDPASGSTRSCRLRLSPIPTCACSAGTS